MQNGGRGGTHPCQLPGCQPSRTASSASKMLDNLRKAGYIDFKKYGSIMVTDKGYEEGRYLLHRHRVLQDFFCTLNHTEDELELVEKIEHFINHRTVENMEQALSSFGIRMI